MPGDTTIGLLFPWARKFTHIAQVYPVAKLGRGGKSVAWTQLGKQSIQP